MVLTKRNSFLLGLVSIYMLCLPFIDKSGDIFWRALSVFFHFLFAAYFCILILRNVRLTNYEWFTLGLVITAYIITFYRGLAWDLGYILLILAVLGVVRIMKGFEFFIMFLTIIGQIIFLAQVDASYSAQFSGSSISSVIFFPHMFLIVFYNLNRRHTIFLVTTVIYLLWINWHLDSRASMISFSLFMFIWFLKGKLGYYIIGLFLVAIVRFSEEILSFILFAREFVLMSDPTVIDLSLGSRVIMWKTAVELIESNPIGFGFRQFINVGGLMASHTHSTFFELYLCFGIFGIVLLLILLMKLYNASFGLASALLVVMFFDVIFYEKLGLILFTLIVNKGTEKLNYARF